MTSPDTPTTAPYGSWRSPITADAIVAESIGISSVSIDGDAILWTESRPSEGGRYVIVRMEPGGAVSDVNPAPFNARTRVHEYGGAAWIADSGTVWFSNFDDQRMYRIDPGGAPEPITPDAPLRYADAALDRARNRLICVREDHSDPDNISQRHRGRSRRRFRGADRPVRRLGFRVLASAEPRRFHPGVDVLEPPQHALGRNASLDRSRA